MNYFTDGQVKDITREAMKSHRVPETDEYVLTLGENQIKAIMNLAVSTAIGEPIGYANGNDLIEDGTSFYLLELWKIKDADEANNIPLYTVKEIS